MSLLNDQDKHQLLSKSILFSQLDIKVLDRLIRFMKSKHFKAREVIFHKADPGNQMCIIINGRVKLSTLSEEGKEMMFGMLEPGDIFGEISLLDGEQRSATVTATKPTERRDLIPFLEQHPLVAIKLLAILAARLRKTDEIFEDTLFRTLPSKLAKKLLALADDYGEQTARGVKISLKLSQQEIGNLVGTSRESINKQLRAWEDEGLLTFHKGYITILQPDELEDLLYLSL
jgi:CRP/FNR family cyclic AMP-dependent transcriptional regulator